MAFAHGRLAYFKVGSTDISAFMDNIDFPHKADVHETTTYGKSWKTKAGGLQEGSFSLGGLYDSTATTGIESIMPALVGTVSTFEYGPEGNGAGKVKYSGSAVVESYDHATPVGDMIRWKANLQTSDTVTKGVYP